MNVFSPNSWLGRFFYLVADIVTLHFLWLLCSLPIVTIGASTTALYYCMMKRMRRDEGYATSNFFSSFKANFFQATILWLAVVLIAFLLFLDAKIGLFLGGIMGNIFLFISSILGLLFLFTLLYLFPVQAKFENRIIDNVKNAFLMSLSNFGYTMLLLLLNVSFVLFAVLSTFVVGVYLVCGAGFYAFMTSGIYVMVFRKYLPDELSEDIEASAIDPNKLM